MKKIFAVFCAVVLLPNFSAQAWIGGPFSNGSFFGLGGDDGVYEAVATGLNTLGFYRIVIANNTAGAAIGTPTTTTQAATTPGSINGIIASGNTIIGGQGNQSNSMWYSAGVAYAGRAFGAVSMWAGSISGISTATQVAVTGFTAANVLNTQFQAAFINTNRYVPARAFAGFGTASLNGAAPITLTVYGSKVSYQIISGL